MKTSTLYFFLFVLTLGKLLLAWFIPAFGDETYYYIWSQHPQLSYFDHPPMVSWFIYLGQLMGPAGNSVSLRIVFIFASFVTALIWIQILHLKNFDNSKILICLVLLLLNPLLGVGSILATPDVPLVLFWSLSYYCYLKIMELNTRRWYILLGLFLGLGFCSKYHIVLFVISGLIYLFWTKNIFRLHLQGVLLTIFFGAVFSLPVIIWNAQNNWASFLFQIQHGFGETSFDWKWPVGYLLAQLLITNPLIFILLFKKNSDSMEKIFSLSQLAFFFTSSFKSVVEGNWPLTSHLHSVTHFCSVANRRLFRYSILYWLAFYVTIGLFFILPVTRQISEAVKKNLVNISQLTELLAITEKFQPLYGPSYQVSSLLSWKTQKLIPKLHGLSRHDFYDTLPEATPIAKIFYVLKYDNSDWPLKYARYKKIKLQGFDNVGLSLYQFNDESYK